MRWGTTLVILLVWGMGGCGGCGGDDDMGPDGGDGLEHEAWAVQCQSRFPIGGIVPLGNDESDAYVRLFNDEDSVVAGGTTRGGITRDGGRTVSLVPLEVDVGTGPAAERRAAVLGGVPEIVGVGPDFFSSMRPRNDAGSNSTGYPAYRVIVVDGEGKEIRATSGSASGVPPLPGNVAADQAWQWDATRWVARRGFRMFATEDGGATWQATGLALEVRVGGKLFVPVGTLGDRVIVQDRTDPASAGPYYLVSDTGERTEIPLAGTVEEPNPALLIDAHLRPWGQRLVYIHRAELWMSDDLGATWTPLAIGEPADPATYEYDATVDDAGNLLVYPIGNAYGEREVVIYRYAPGTTSPTVIHMDFEGLEMRYLVDLHGLSGGRLRFVAHPHATRETYGWFLCTAEAGGTQAIEHAAVESMDAAYSSGRVVRLERFKELSLHTDRMALSAYGRPYVSAFQHLLTLPQDAPLFYDGRIPSTGLGVLPGALVPFASNWTFHAYLWNLETETAAALFDARTGKVFDQSIHLTQRVYSVGTGVGAALLHTESGSYSSTATLRLLGDPPLPTFPNQLVTSLRDGALLSNLAHDRFHDLLEPAYLVRFDPTAERIPSLAACYPQPPAAPPATCDPVPPMSVIAATFDADGNLYALDQRRGRVMMLPAGASGEAAWRAVGTGFISPSDLQIVPYGDGWMAVVYDGDVWAFAIDPAAPKVRGAAAPERSDAPVIAARDAHDCMADGPCLDDTAPFVNLATVGTTCLAGRGLGSESGVVLAGATPLDVTSWTDQQVCVRATDGLRDGQLQLVRADGAASNRLPYEAPNTFSAWTIPSEVYPDTAIRAVGHNLQRGGDRAVVAWALEAGERTVSVGRAAAQTSTTVTVRPRVRHGCRVGRREACTIYGAGFGASGTSATIGGQPAAIAAWSRYAVSLEWPAGLAPGVHEVTLAGPGWSASAGTVVLLADAEAPLLLQHDAPQTTAFRYLHPRPVLTSRGLMASMDDWTWGSPDGVSVPVNAVPMVVAADLPESAFYDAGEVLRAWTFEQGLLLPERPMHVIEHGGDVYFVGTASGTPNATSLLRLVESMSGGTTVYTTPEVVRVPFGMQAQVAAAGIVDGHAIVVAADRITSTAQVTAVALAGAAATVVDSATLALHAAPNLATHGGFFAGRDLYLATCHDPDRGARVERVTVTVSGGELTLGAAALVHDVPAARLVACATTDDGFLWIEREGAAYRVMRTVGGAPPTTVATLPGTLPGIGDVHTFNGNDRLDGVTDVALLADGDLLVLLNEHDSEPRGLHLARRNAGDGAWTVQHAVTPAAMMQRGEVCVGPAFNPSACDGYGRDGCSPAACAQRPPEVRPRASTHVGEAYMVVRGADVSLVYEAVDTERVLTDNLATGFDVLHVRVPLP